MFYVCHCMCILGGGVALGGEFSTGHCSPRRGIPFRYRGCTGRRHSDEAVIMKEADVWP